jgi:hypothetical protein
MKTTKTLRRGAFRRRLWALPLVFVLFFAVLAGSALAATDEPSTAATAEPAPPIAAGQTAATDQAANSSASAPQQQPRNIVVIVRVDSPGDDGGVTQTNVSVAGSGASNDGSTSQSAADGAAPAQDASTSQDASSTATASQDQAGNIVVIVRVNSPGDDGPISQTNTSAAGSSASNTSSTDQASSTGAGENGAAGGTGTPNDASRDTPAPIGPPAQQQSEAPTPPAPAATSSRRGLVDLPAPTRSRHAKPASHAAAPKAGPVATRTLSPDAAPTAPAATERTTGILRPQTWREGRAPAARRDRGLSERAAGLLNTFAPSRPQLPAGEGSKDVSSAVLITLLAVLGGAFLLAGSTYAPARRRVRNLRSRWNG